MLKAKPNYRILGPRCGKDIKRIVIELDKLSTDDIIALKQGGSITILGHELSGSDLVFEGGLEAGPHGIVSADGSLLVELDVELDEALIAEGFARELTTHVNKLRREQGMSISDRVHVFLECESMMFAVLLDTFCNVRSDFMRDVCCDVMTLTSREGAEQTIIFTVDGSKIIDDHVECYDHTIVIHGIKNEELDDMEVEVRLVKC